MFRREGFRLAAVRPDSEPHAGIGIMIEEIAGDPQTEAAVSTRDQNRTHVRSIAAASTGVNFNTGEPRSFPSVGIDGPPHLWGGTDGFLSVR